MSAVLNSTVETITPEQAAVYLERKATNRKLSNATVIQYAQIMKAGKWLLNGEAIKFDTNGRLNDGQHRLAGVIKAGVPIQTLVVRGVVEKAFETFDSGKGRSVPDVLSMYGVKYPITTAGVLRIIYQHAKNGTPHTAKFGRIPTALLLAFFHENKQREERLAEAAADGTKYAVPSSLFAPRVAGYLSYVGNIVDRDLTTEFFAALTEPRREDHPVMSLKRRILRSANSKDITSIEESLALTVKTWNALYNNQPVNFLRYRMFGAKPDSFPEFAGLDVKKL